MENKPVLIYSMPRAHSTAMLFSCNRELKFNEPFDIRRRNSDVVKTTKNVKLENIIDIPFEHLYYENWDNLTSKLHNKNCVVKILAMSLMLYYPARKWYTSVINGNDFDVFVTNRSMYDIAWSTILATKYGFRKEWETEAVEIEIPVRELKEIALNFDSFLRFFPNNATAIDINNLPNTHFGRVSENNVKVQNSLTKKSLIKNFNECDDEIRYIVELFADEWTSKYHSIGATAKIW
jgi:hypothetical protein